jgi:hypothetical protein
VLDSHLTELRPGLRLAALLCAAAAAPQVVAAAPLTFEAVFGSKGEPAALHYQATFVSRGAEHRLEVWRDGDRQVRRRSDDAVETYAFHDPGTVDFRMSVLDLKRRIHTRIDRDNLYRLGNFTDWFDLTHGLKHPRGPYQLAPGRAAAGTPAPLESCRWYELTEGSRVTRICWSSRDRIPVLIQTAGGEVVWRITAVDRSPVPAATFEIHDAGFVRNDANADIEND